MRTLARASVRAASRPPNPPPMITTCGGIVTLEVDSVWLLHADATFEIRDRAVDGRKPVRRSWREHDDVALGDCPCVAALQRRAAHDVRIGRGRRGRRLEHAAGD